MATVEPVADSRAAVVDLGDERALAVADYHAGIEAGLRYERGVELDSNAAGRRERLLGLVEATGVDRVVVLGDLVHRVSDVAEVEREEVDALVDALAARDVGVTLATGNHDPGVAEAYADRIETLPTDGARRGAVGLVHGHTWPAESVVTAETLCIGHEHPTVRIEDVVGGSRIERCWLRGRLDRGVVADGLGVDAAALDWPSEDPELVVFPAFNDRSGGSRVNVDGQGFLSPLLPEALVDGEAYLLDGTRLGPYRTV
ncbi:MAG: metallophosphoesterase [Halolamina sp.]